MSNTEFEETRLTLAEDMLNQLILKILDIGTKDNLDGFINVYQDQIDSLKERISVLRNRISSLTGLTNM